MQWTDDAILLKSSPHGETSLVVSLLTSSRGRQVGLIRGAQKSRQRGLYEIGNRVAATWNARLAEHLGLFRLEPIDSIAAVIFDDALRLVCLDAAIALADISLPEREPHGHAFLALSVLLDSLRRDESYAVAHLKFELTLLTELGFGLDLAACAVTGATSELAYVSPRTGRAVSLAAGAAYRERLLILPRLLGGLGREGTSDPQDLLDGLSLSGFFFERSIFPAGQGRAMPLSRARYIERLTRMAGSATKS
jgi:DNA repair protein RecO (recombination protein O)